MSAAYQGPAVFLMGPTGSGKTALALTLAERLPAEIISVDSAQIYRGLNIGSAKPTPGERRRVPHHLLDICDPAESYSAQTFSLAAGSLIEQIAERGRVPLLVGGTGLYFRALEQGLAELPAAERTVRAGLHEELARSGVEALHARLALVDPPAAERIHPRDPQRIVRALEVYALTGRPMSELWREARPPALRRAVVKFVLAPAVREQLHQRLARRFSRMLDQGLVNEVLMLRRRGDLSKDCPAVRTVGYRAVWRYLEGQSSYAEMLERGVIATRQLAKRQLTWLRREQGCRWMEMGAPGLSDVVLAALAMAPEFKSVLK